VIDDDDRPDPDALLAQVKADEVRETRARLKLFFGAAPGVGKTYAMLTSARALRADDVDVVVGLVETHGRRDTAALLAGLEVLPRRTIDHRGVEVEELDLEAILARRPEVVLVDELAHTNAPGSRHVKRWQDVLELLEAGIDVHSTLNVQHVESLNDVVAQITGVKVRETVPDAVLERADELELIDVPLEELLERLADGKVYLPDQAARATQHFFQRGNLLALRELALRRTAAHVDADVRRYRHAHGIATPWAARERILVGIGPSPGSERLVRAAKRMSQSLDATWVAAYVEPLGAGPLGAADRERLEGHLRLAESLGGEVLRLTGPNVSEALLTYARAHNVTRILAGKPTHSRLRDWLRGSMLVDLIRGSGAIDVHVISPLDETTPRAPPAEAPAEARASPAAYAWASGAIALVTATCLVVHPRVALADITMLYLIAIMIASLAGRGPSILAASLAVAAFDFCFVPPRFTFAVSDAKYILTFAVMFGAGLVVSAFTVRLRREEQGARRRERDTAALLAFTRDIGTANGTEDVAAATVRHLEDVLGVAAAALVPDGDGGLTSAAGLMPLAPQELTVARWSFDHAQLAGHGTDTLPGARILALPLVVDEAAVGVVVVQTRGGARLDRDHRHVLDAFVRQAALAIGRARLAEEARDAALRVRAEELRNALLSAVSHDLRTPLAVVTGAATRLRDGAATMTAATRAELLDTVVDEAQRLERVLANLLSITRVETGLRPAREWVPVDELVGATLTRLEGALGERPVAVRVPAELAVPVDPVLFEQALLNLIENAIKHGTPPIEISARAAGEHVELEVADHGAGLPEGSEAKVFDKFFRASKAPGVGLGLAVVRGIVEAHGGTISAENRAGGGACFRIVLPAAAEPPAVPAPGPE